VGYSPLRTRVTLAAGPTTRDYILSPAPVVLPTLVAEGRRSGIYGTVADSMSFETATKPMRTEAASAGFYDSPWGKHPRIQLLTVAEILDGKRIDYPRTAGINQTYKQAPRAVRKVAEPKSLFEPENDA
jgi:hypothetical protein